jgi:hypothetical protein
VGIAVGGFYLKSTVADFEYGNVECTAAQVVDSDGLSFFLSQSIIQRSGCRLVDDSKHIKAGDFSAILGCLSLGIIEVSRTVITASVTFSPRYASDPPSAL